MEQIISKIDNSVNFVKKTQSGFFESRYVRRNNNNDYFITYLSVQDGCNLGCRMCHLTATKQTSMQESSITDLSTQALYVFDHYKTLIEDGKQEPTDRMHFNFMSRGEALNTNMFSNNKSAYETLKTLRFLAESELSMHSTFLISTIMPNSFEDKSLKDIFKIIHPHIYYSIYSLNPKFRKKWLSNAMSPDLALEKLKEWSDFSGGKVKIHHAFIKGENDSESDVRELCEKLKSFDLYPDFNIVSYNPFSEKHGEESSKEVIERNKKIIESELSNNVKIIPRVGIDVKASCGMFVSDK